MVLQNKYKARASARYNAERGGSGRGTSGGRGGSRGRGRGGRGRGAGWGGHADDDGDGQDGTDQDGEEDDEDGDEDHDAENVAFPSLHASASASQSAASSSRREEKVPSKYAKRKLESNAWRYKQDETEDNPDAEPEPEVDLSALFARVAKLDSSKNAVITIGAPSSSSQSKAETVETAEDIEADIDHSLAYLYERERARERARTGRATEQGGSGGNHVVEVASMTAKERARMEQEAEEMKADKEKADALRALKERFQGRATGERARVSNVRRLVSEGLPSESKADTRPRPAHLQPERDRLPSHAKTWAAAKGEDADGSHPQDPDDLFFDEVVGATPDAPLSQIGKASRGQGGATKGSATSSSAQKDTKEMEDFLDAMLG
ncbi:hypothetical protein OC861_002317 [Tilletia horrida]|nr:hypothetical protein OC861_002317 [Tilletia horrida]